jgi:hypothetical protein
MMGQRLAPRVEHRGETNLSAEMPGIAGNGLERLGRSLEQKAIDERLVLVRDGGNLLRQREDHMEILDWQQVRLACFQPRTCRRALAGGTMPIPATAVGDLLVPTLLAATYVAPEDRCAAGLNRCHHPTLATIEVAGIGLAIGLAVVTEDFRHLKGGTSHACWLSPTALTPAEAASPAP